MSMRRLSALAVWLTGVTLGAHPQTAALAGAGQGATTQAATQTALSLRINDLLRQSAAASAHWGIAVTTMDGTPLYNLQDTHLFRPASTAKLFTTAAAMALLGPQHRFRTQLFGVLGASGDVEGDLTLVGGGDASFGTQDLPYRRSSGGDAAEGTMPKQTTALASMVSRLKVAGLQRVSGNIVGDDSLFEEAVPPEGWAAEDLPWSYGALPSALSVSDNELRVTLTSKGAAAAGSDPRAQGRPFVQVEQLFPYLDVLNEVVTGPPEAGRTGNVGVQFVPGARAQVRLFGTVPANAPAVTERLSLNDPARYAAGALRQELVEAGVEVSGTVNVVHSAPATDSPPFLSTVRTPGCEVALWGAAAGCSAACPAPPQRGRLLAEQMSEPLAQEVVYTLKTSANLHAEVLLHHLGLLAACPGVTTLQGARVLHSWLLHLGLTDNDFVLYDGSGLSTKDLVSPRAEARLLAYAATQPWFAEWKAALPIGGVDGTLSARFTEDAMKGRVAAKTGTLGETRALAGYVRCASGKEVIVTILVDNHLPGSTADRTTMDSIVAAIVALN